jgi:5-methyltetrahydrofolate--homocysteine methyltransferase
MNFVNIGERTNVAGSRKFLRLVKEEKFEEAAAVAREQVENGARIIDVNVDDGMIDGPAAMSRFLDMIGSDPEIARVPVMIDSSDFDVVEEGLKHLQGRGIVNSISLKEGEENFLEKAVAIRRMGAAALVMAFDEKGQADTFARRVEICERAYKLLVEKAGYAPSDIVMDPNVFAIATGMPEHDSHAKDFIDAVAEIKKRCPGALVSGGISNVSFSFRGNDAIRGAIHAVFLYHAIANGLDMGIVNPAHLTVYDEIPEDLREIVEDAVLNRRPGASERLMEVAEKFAAEADGGKSREDPEWRSAPPHDRIFHAMLKGEDKYIV